MKRVSLKRMQCGVLISVFIFSACADSHYGYSKEEWDKLSDQQQRMVKKEYEAILKKNKDLEHDQLLRERDEQIIRRGLGQPY